MSRTSLVGNELIYGKVVPSNLEIEQAVIGAILLEKDAFYTVSEILTENCFYSNANKLIFKAIQRLAAENKPIEIYTVTEELQKTGDLDNAGGPYYVAKTTNYVASSANIIHHCRILYDKFAKREIIRIGAEMVNGGYSDETDWTETAQEAEKGLTSITLNNQKKDATEITAALVEQVRRVEELRSKNTDITGVPSGFPRIDRITNGWQDTDLIILAARPSVGKTAFALNLARNAAMNNIRSVPVLLFSLEMSTGQLTQRLMSSTSGIWLEKIARGKMSDEESKTMFTKAVQPLAKTKIYIDDTPALNVFELRTRARKAKMKHGIGLVVIDYLQLMSGPGNQKNINREQEISQISRGLKQMAKELNIPVIALSQLSRQVESRSDKRPQLSDLRESGAIEQDADMVMFMYRPEYYGIQADENGDAAQGLTLIDIAKHRNGDLARGDFAIKLKADLAIQQFTEFTEGWAPVHNTVPDTYRSTIADEKDDTPF